MKIGRKKSKDGNERTKTSEISIDVPKPVYDWIQYIAKRKNESLEEYILKELAEGIAADVDAIRTYVPSMNQRELFKGINEISPGLSKALAGLGETRVKEWEKDSSNFSEKSRKSQVRTFRQALRSFVK
jgi:hypothetical protein